MKNFSSKRRGSFHRSFSPASVLALCCIIAAVACLLLFRGAFGATGAFLSVPLYKAYSTLTDLPFSFFRSRLSMEREIEELKSTILAQSGSEYTLGMLQTQNKELRTLLGATHGDTKIAAGVVARPPTVPYDALVIDRGTGDGIVENAVVYFANDRAIGTIARAYDDSAVVKLFSTPLSETTVYIVGPNIYTTAHGAGGGVIRVSVPQGIVLSEGDLVLLPGLDGGVLGKISAIQSEATNPEQNAYIVHDVPLQSLRVVSVSQSAPPVLSFEEARANIENQKQAFLLEVPAGVLVDVGTTTPTSTATTTEE